MGDAVAVSQSTEQQDNAIAQTFSAQIEVPEDVKEHLANWIAEEIERAKSERHGLEDNILKWNRLYEAKPEQEIKTEPWEGAANLVVPAAATAVEAIHSRIMGAVFGGKSLYHVTPRSGKWADISDSIDTWINWVAKYVMKMYKVCQTWFLSTIKHGTGVLKLPWERRKRNVVYRDRTGAEVRETVNLFDGPLPQPVPLIDFFFSPDSVFTQDIQTCEWIAHRFRNTWKTLKEKEASEIYFDVERIKENKRTEVEDVEQHVADVTGLEVTEPDDYELFEVWCSYDVEGSGNLSELIVTIHPETRTILRAVYNFFRHQERPFHVLRYMVREDTLLGIGIPEMLEDVQTELTAIHNHRLDNATIANTRAWKRRRGSVIGDDEIFPGAFFDVDDMEDIQELRLGDVYPSLLTEEMHTNTIGEKRTGVSDYTVGRESSAIGSRATATSTLALIREGNKRFQMFIREIREVLGDIASQAIMLYQQFAPDGRVMYEMIDDSERQMVQQYMSLPLDVSRRSVLIDVAALSETNNKEIQQQTMLTLLQTVQQIYASLMQAFQVAVNPQAPEPIRNLAIQGAKTGSTLFERLLESFDFKDAESFAPDIEALLGIASFQEGGMAPDPGMMGVQAPDPAQEILNAVNGPRERQTPSNGAGREPSGMGDNRQGAAPSPGFREREAPTRGGP